jgi:hypothetical protein
MPEMHSGQNVDILNAKPRSTGGKLWDSKGYCLHPMMLFENDALEICACKEIREDAWLSFYPED